MDRLPFQATAGGALYEGIRTLPVAVLLDNVRSMYNVGAFFRTADAASVEKLYLCGITARPPKKSHRQNRPRRPGHGAVGALLGCPAAGRKHARAGL